MARSIERYLKYLISCDGRPAGCVSCRNLVGRTYEIGCLCVVPEFQRRGIGAAAMGFIQAAHPDWEVFTLIPPADKGGNMQFYIRKCGFQLEKLLSKAERGTKKLIRRMSSGTTIGNRTLVFAVRGRRLDRLTMVANWLPN